MRPPTPLILSAAYHAYTRIVPSQNASNADLTLASSTPTLSMLTHPQRTQEDTPTPPSPLLTLLHPRPLQSLCSRGPLNICLQRRPQPSLRLLLRT
ncbi:hypothetical protein O181_020262 [Austropuccinia psidii MF-1]|uniref:Uncharacterized protein n=1 Tax=Austropuccinia psidii MF-1 TaxID=1389203 RepID=A0A9Q3CBC6_9BASI|nr:hypothetical protein [Austropuccinia psidii MF-1]